MTFVFLFFGTLAVVGAFSLVKIHRQELRDAREARRKATERIAAYRLKCYRPDGD